MAKSAFYQSPHKLNTHPRALPDDLRTIINGLKDDIKEVETLADAAQTAAEVTSAIAPTLTQALKEALYGFFPGKPGAGAILYKWRTPFTTHVFTANLGGANSRATCEVASTAEKVFTIKKITSAGASSDIGTITFAIDGTVGTIAVAGSTTLALGDALAIVGPDPADATAADFTFVFSGART